MSNSLKRIYEAMFLVDSAVAAADWNEVKEAINKVMARAEVEVISLRKWDERRLAYEIANHKRGMYILCYFKASPEAIVGIERDVQLSELLLRALILQADHITEEQMRASTPAMQKEANETAIETAAETEVEAEVEAEMEAEEDAEA